MDKDNQSQFEPRTTPVEENIGWIKTAWRLERIGFFLLGLFILYALLGGFSQGWLSDSRYQNEEKSTQITYEKYLRSDTESPLIIAYPLKEAQSDHITLSGKFVNEYDIINVSPESAVIHRSPGTMIIYPNNTGVTNAGNVQLTLKPRKFGIYTLSVAANNDSPFIFKQIVFP
ncbi:hypothetical protein GRAQ_04614 [Rahnella aquatilis CIP 78.65 = ATCC 33071]|uniref:Uncharacterized protein n=1 Tax=Rahnella aquatilis (strain ATCC 33071 / DSM 4594 / JCM 1683 / NBRC 105701 / NCIMB 13365 / CIP 78.65) TaxID=745277 RepID=H2J1W2_RAHAC|nr:hypothetical protein [Rahnella aquatilis]AEX54559.1 hypothetical protein Rahaq2_4840 [Rahnella aquatilis CIP 78.65 = ATCC 33071]KFD00030.1 hypothetical protein GRAQ_04614 [Rahnella aquatilis CIP 78.65 = ATCC 33071]